jgi:gas vesicle protein
MKNPLQKETLTGLIAGVVIGGVIAAGLAYLFFTEDGKEALESLKHRIKDMAKDLAAGVISYKTGVSILTNRKNTWRMPYSAPRVKQLTKSW